MIFLPVLQETSWRSVTCLADNDQMNSIVRRVIGATGTTIAGLADAFLLASTTEAGTDTDQKFTAGDGSTVLMPSQLKDMGYLYQAIFRFECAAYFGERYPPLVPSKTLPPA